MYKLHLFTIGGVAYLQYVYKSNLSNEGHKYFYDFDK